MTVYTHVSLRRLLSKKAARYKLYLSVCNKLGNDGVDSLAGNVIGDAARSL